MSLKRQRDYTTYPKGPYKKTNFSMAAPLMTGLFNKSFGKANYSKKNNKSYGGRKGPYSLLSNGVRHTNPVYPKPECKMYDATQTGATPPPATPVNTPIPNTGLVACLNQLVTGSGVQNFTGNQITVKSVAYRYELDLPATAANQRPTSGRVMLIWDRQPNGQAADYTEIFSTSNYLAFANVNTRERFVILRNDQYSLSPNGDQTIFVERFVKINMVSTYVNGQTGAAVPQTGAVLLVYISDQATEANQPTISAVARVRYYDN